jgi:PAS domain S-box-containing protein
MLGWLTWWGYRAGLYGTDFGVTLMVVINSAALVAVVLWTAEPLDRADRERTQANEKLQSSQTALTAAERIAHLGSWDLDLVSNKLTWSDEIYRIFGLTSQSFGATYAAFLHSVHPDDREFVKRSVDEALRGQKPYNIDHRIVLPDGAERIVHEQGEVFLDDTGRAVRMVGMVQDITERKQAEEALGESEKRYRSVVSSMAEGVALLDATGTIIAWNKSAERIRGLTADEILGRGSFDPHRGAIYEDGAPFPAKDQPAMVTLWTGQPQSDVCMGVHKPDGTMTWISINSQPIFGADPTRPQAVVVTFSDITEHKRIEEELRQLSAYLLEAQDEERRRIARDLHDSTAQSLAAIAINLGLLGRSGGLDGDAQKRVAESVSLAKQCSDEIRNVSYLLHPPLLDELGLASAVRWYVEGLAQRSGIRVDLEISSELGRLPKETETALFRIVQEGLMNIHRHSGSATAKVRIVRDAAGAKLEVVDAGTGIRATGVETLDGRRVRPGVGISGMRERLRLLGGKLEIDSSPQGTTVKASLPLDGSNSP